MKGKKFDVLALLVQAVDDFCRRFSPDEVGKNQMVAHLALEMTPQEFHHAMLAVCLKQGLAPTEVRRYMPPNGEHLTPEHLNRLFELILRRQGLITAEERLIADLDPELKRIMPAVTEELVEGSRLKAIALAKTSVNEAVKSLGEKYMELFRQFAYWSCAGFVHELIGAFHALPKDQALEVAQVFPLFAGLLPEDPQGSEVVTLIAILADISQI